MRLPIALLAFFSLLYAVWIALGLPPEETIAPIARGYFERFGLLAVLVAAFIEGLFVIGWYFPGSTIIVVCLVLSTSSTQSFVIVSMSAGIGLLTAYCFNYAMGKYGWYKLLVRFGYQASIENGKARLHRHGLAAIFLTYWQFLLASAVSTASGILQYSFPKFLLVSVVSVVFWTTFWSTIIYFLGAAAMQLVGIRFILAIIVAWITIALAVHYIRRWRKRG